jgi:hypothetical protein
MAPGIDRIMKDIIDERDAGDLVSVTWGAEKFSPVQYHTFDLGPFSYTTKVRPGETPAEAAQRAYKVCERIARETYVDKRDEFLRNVREAASAAKAARGG